jgi:dihydrofolate reductase
LDGVMQAPGDSREDLEGGFPYGGWQMPYFDEDAGSFMGEAFERTGALLLGRVTYQIFADYWPTAPKDDPVTELMNRIPKYVASNTLDRVEWSNSHLIRGNVPEEVAKLKQAPDSGNLSVIGSSKLAQTLMQHGLVDEYVLWIHPVVLGTGKRLFAEGIGPLYFRLVEAKTTKSGIVALTYEPQAQPGTGGTPPG